jgi:osmotically-inducible protein OsmY
MEFLQPADEDLSARVQDALAYDPAVRAADEIAVLVRDGVVTLRGTVPDRDKRAAAADAAARAAGPGAVVNLLEVDDGPRGDAELRAAALQALMYDTTLPSERIDVEVNGGRITLSGRVRHRHQRDRAVLGLAGLAGVRHIDNRITVRRD